jgi:hypothetical protein
MQPGDLVFHIDDIKDRRFVPGLVIRIIKAINQEEAVVYFVDRTFSEFHHVEELIKVEDYEGDINDYR